MRDDGLMEHEPLTPEWLKEQLRKHNKTQAALVRYLRDQGVDIDAAKMSKTLKGERKLQLDEHMPIWVFFGNDPNEFFKATTEFRPPLMVSHVERAAAAERLAETIPPMPNAGLPERFRLASGRLPIFGVSVGGEARSRTLFNGQKMGEVNRPASLADNYRAYATYVHGESMEPRYEAGEIVLVNPDKGYRRGNYVVAQVYDSDGDPPFGYIKRFISFGDELVLEQLNPPEGEDRIMRFPRNKVVSVHRIVGTLDE